MSRRIRENCGSKARCGADENCGTCKTPGDFKQAYETLMEQLRYLAAEAV